MENRQEDKTRENVLLPVAPDKFWESNFEICNAYLSL
jgi:hypothetical protein